MELHHQIIPTEAYVLGGETRCFDQKKDEGSHSRRDCNALSLESKSSGAFLPFKAVRQEGRGEAKHLIIESFLDALANQARLAATAAVSAASVEESTAVLVPRAAPAFHHYSLATRWCARLDWNVMIILFIK
ncbi:hypothetical protein MA16_Dca006023 [Dendrobium catenatum]|uniref:Uncharacterized protein n=1 Tax=Dendrobium catenatum TaxID=906689 RepID=A0A2I0WJZ7_9ASPA|nr:hypothetical protein MA16_Dca006023 [Dendrobium catenatum]